MAIVEALSEGLRKLTKFERILAGVLAFTPFLLFWADSGSGRDSISDYFRMEENQLFYIPLTAAAMLFVVNGIADAKNIYNTSLGVALAGLLLFNHIEFNAIHNFFAISFFAGSALVIIFFSGVPWRYRAIFVVLIGALILVWALIDSFTLFWAESAALFVIAGHFIADSWEGPLLRSYGTQRGSSTSTPQTST